MIDFAQGCSYDEYLQKGYEEERERQQKAGEHTVFTPEFEAACRGVSRRLKLAVFAEIYCPDTVVTMPFVCRMAELNPLVEISIFERSPFETVLKEYSGTARIPTLLFFDENGSLLGSYVELPADLKTGIEKDPSRQKALVLDLRRGKYNDLIQKELAALLSSFAD